MLAELRAKGITCGRDHAGVEVDGVVQEEVINFSRGEDPTMVQAVLDRVDYGKARAGVMGLSLAIVVRRRAWEITIRRIDGKPDEELAKLHGQLISRAHVRELIPDWQRLSWTDGRVTSPGAMAESEAEDPPYRVILSYPAGADAVEMRSEFLNDLAI